MSSNPPTPAQNFWTSKTFWTLLTGLAFNIVQAVHPIAAPQAQEIINALLLVLGIIFRWQANQPLTTSGGTTVP